ncbi:MAG: Stp1/IreP family PP2C-type Ser/Thr phosphatase [Oscillospiraceae bacterium]|nr:Stp1/IreP family PP2C-type Ser/Thr phosphatase [Oscillospiraceae bacterium]
MKQWGVTDSGKVRTDNQDVFKLLDDEKKGVYVLVVCDGIGGAKAGNVASSIAADTFMESIERYVGKIGSINEIANNMSLAVSAANMAVYEKSIREYDYAGMGTTLTAAVSTTQGEVIVNIGDSRAYHVTSKAISQITKDHTVIEDLVTSGEITRDQAKEHPSKHLITKALGTSIIDPPDIFHLNLKSGEHILLCSDGLTDVVSDDEILIELQRGLSVRECCENLLLIALLRGAPDNVTIVIFQK